MVPWEDVLETIYYDPKLQAKYVAPQKLYKVVKDKGKCNIGKHRKRTHAQKTYSLHNLFEDDYEVIIL